MRVFVAGAGGAVGRSLVRELTGEGHEVVAMTRSSDKLGALRDLGATPVVADGLDRDAVMRAVTGARPEVVVHEMTGLAGVTSFRRFDQAFALTNRLRTEGTDLLLEAARAAEVRRVVAQSFGNWNYERSGGPVKSEDDTLDPSPPASMRRSLEAIRHLEAAVVGPRASRGWRSATATVDDAAAATAAALERGAPGVYNVADDEPAPAAAWLPQLATALGARPPRRVPAWVGRLAAGEAAVSMFTRIRGASNAKIRAALGWRPLHPSWREGFRSGLDEAPRPREGRFAPRGGRR
jgi:nucleoside-diphosphate-sugar epimerase